MALPVHNLDFNGAKLDEFMNQSIKFSLRLANVVDTVLLNVFIPVSIELTTTDTAALQETRLTSNN